MTTTQMPQELEATWLEQLGLFQLSVAEATEKRDYWVAIRNESIVAARVHGMSLRKIGTATGLSHTAVAKIINGM